MATSILYLTDNSLSEPLFSLCQRILKREAGDIPIVSVSHKPIGLGHNICVGEMKRCWMTLYKQLLAGLDAVETENVAIAEHDCLYSHEHLSWQPPDPDTFFYNENHWLLQGPGSSHPELLGMFSYWRKRTALSQLICRADFLKQATEEVMRLLDMGLRVERGLHWYGEPGVVSEQFRKAFVEASSGRPTQLQAYLKDYVTHYRSEFFRTETCNVDIRHGTNFTGPKRGQKRRFDLPYWGTLADVMGQ